MNESSEPPMPAGNDPEVAEPSATTGGPPWPPPSLTPPASDTTGPPPGRRRRRRLAAGVAGLAALGMGAGVAIGYSTFAGTATTAVVRTSSEVSTPASTVDPGLVDIDTVLGDETAKAAGTGMVLTSTGLVLTNNHVIEGATSITVTDVGNHHTYTATVVGYDESADVAVIKLTDASGLSTITVGDSSGVSVGESVVAIGNAGGTGGTPHVARGTVVALSKSITAEDELSARTEQLSGLLETDADIEAGDSGGPLVNQEGQVVAMDTAASASGSGGFSFSSGSSSSDTTQGYAIPIDAAIRIAKEIEAGDSSSTVHIGSTAFLGVGVRSDGTSGPGAGQTGQTTGTTTGVEVIEVESGSAAAKAGIVAGDEITSIDGTAVTSPTALSEVIATLRSGATVSVSWTDSAGTTQRATVTLTSGPAG